MKQKLYESILQQVIALLENEYDLIANTANISAILFQQLPNINWAGFYFYKDNELILGPFQGKPACMHLKMKKGVCGTAAANQEIIIVPNVHEFPGHIACDFASNSEIVIPILYNKQLIGVLDIDSFDLNNFDEIDAIYLHKLICILCDHIK